MNKRIDMAGQRFGRLTVQSYAGNQRWRCVCDCGTTKVVSRSNLISNQIMSCGCLFKDVLVQRNTSHGMSLSPEYKSWSQAKSRCFLKTNKDYHLYGGRGVTMCERWLEFAKFYEDMGERPKNTSLDRKDNNGNYEPDNCRWATKQEQANNRNTTTHLTAFGETKPFVQWLLDTRCVVSYTTLSQRVRVYGWPAEKAISTPARK